MRTTRFVPGPKGPFYWFSEQSLTSDSKGFQQIRSGAEARVTIAKSAPEAPRLAASRGFSFSLYRASSSSGGVGGGIVPEPSKASPTRAIS